MKMSRMTDVNVLHRKIREMSKMMANPRPQLTVRDIAGELNMSSDQLMPTLVELKDLRLIQFNEPGLSTIKLTLLGCTVQR
jgi:predicted transcriptional regulator